MQSGRGGLLVSLLQSNLTPRYCSLIYCLPSNLNLPNASNLIESISGVTDAVKNSVAGMEAALGRGVGAWTDEDAEQEGVKGVGLGSHSPAAGRLD
jgi:hypothetical protein